MGGVRYLRSGFRVLRGNMALTFRHNCSLHLDPPMKVQSMALK